MREPQGFHPRGSSSRPVIPATYGLRGADLRRIRRGTCLAPYPAESREVYAMHALRRLKIRSGEAGFTLAEIMVACAIISVGLVAVSTGFGFGVDGVEAGRQQSTAVFLAEQRIEQAKELAMRQTGLVQLTVANLPATEAYG